LDKLLPFVSRLWPLLTCFGENNNQDFFISLRLEPNFTSYALFVIGTFAIIISKFMFTSSYEVYSSECLKSNIILHRFSMILHTKTDLFLAQIELWFCFFFFLSVDTFFQALSIGKFVPSLVMVQHVNCLDSTCLILPNIVNFVVVRYRIDNARTLST